MEKDENVVMLYARTGQSDDRKQTCLEHAQNVALIAFEKGEKIGLGALMRLCGLLHDAGKVRGEFQAYLLDDEAKRGTVEHSAYGAVYAFLRWHGGSAFRKLTAELLTFAIASHHGRLPDGVPLYCLTTAQCPEHRLKLLGEVRALLKARQPVVCVATQLIEAGVDVSFGLVVRALAGLDSVAQAAGRCNRNAERELGEVWLVCIEGENLACLREIEAAQREMKSALDAFHADPQRYGNDLLSPALIERYFRTILRVRQGEMCYPLNGSRTLLDLLSSNAYGRNAYATFQKAKYADTMLSQAFRTAGQRFSALDASPFSLLVPYGKGAEYIDRLDGGPELAQAARLLRAAQRYTVTVYPGKLEQFRRLHCVRELPIYGSYALDKAYYDDFLGVAADRKEMGLLDI